MSRKMTEADVSRVVSRLYRDAQEMDWEHLAPGKRTKQYAAWLEEPEVGGVLEKWMGREEARVWMKDGPMKEYSRALAGLGPFASFVNAPQRGPGALVAACLGTGWKVDVGSVGVKPLHCDAINGKRKVRVIWGPARDFKHLLWAALEAADRQTNLEVCIAVLETVERGIGMAERNRFERLGKRCGIAVKHVRV